MTSPKRRLFLSDEIDMYVVRPLMNAIFEINAYDDEQEEKVVGYERKPIEMHIISNGGVVTDGFALINAMEMSKTPIHTYGFGTVASMAVPIFAAGDRRFAARFTRFMYHDISYGSYFQSIVTHEEKLEESRRMQKEYDGYLIERTSIPQELLNEVKEKKKDFFITAQEAVGYNLADEIIPQVNKKKVSLEKETDTHQVA